jgi:hypothetical protein
MFRLFADMFARPEANMLYLAPTFPLIRDMWYPKVEAYLESLGVPYNINRGENTINIHNCGKVFCRTMENPGRIIGFEVLHAFLDEFDTLPVDKAIEVWRKAKARCRQKIYYEYIHEWFSFIEGRLIVKRVAVPNQMFVATTPEGFKATYQLFKKDPLPNSKLIQMSTYSNAHNLPEDYIEELLGNYPAQLIEAYINGEFVNLTNKPVWGDFDRRLNNSADVVTDDDTSLIVGMDFNVGRGCAVVYVWREGVYQPRCLHAVDEVYNSYDTPDTIRILKSRYPDKNIIVYPDATGKSRKSVNATISDIAALKQAGFKVKAHNKNPPIKDRIMAANRQFCNGKGERNLFVNIEKCPYFTDGLEQQIYDKNGLPEKGEGKGDDITDAGTYPVQALFPIKKLEAKRVELTQIIGG